MKIQISDLAAAKLLYILYQEHADQPLAFRVMAHTSGCGTASFAIDLIEVLPHFESIKIKDVPFAWIPSERAWMDGLIIDLNRDNGKFILAHPNPPSQSQCQLS
ncbi:Fe-S cluster assembly iron-binding protein IscA [Croceifilum oryzae]|uniref:Fe-S cluster assembly iron-binding protein IscA n=1 Tax=Croceifilum oryzae TaxID=1553429 RepID=A0AAJ1TC72_9BACL|nr:iron-sulfur cluster biosynthesis family protein [Croceifilum oryzae]MDQ0416165.1 Fe-S cluster assembly iron-binding protein IscA [Croceifilum oryzae]